MTLFKETSIRKKLYIAFACMWAIMIFFAFFRGQQLGTVMDRYNQALTAISTKQQYIGNIVTTLSQIRFDNLLLSTMDRYAHSYEILPLTSNDVHIDLLHEQITAYRLYILNDSLLSEIKRAENLAIIDYICYFFDHHYVPSSNNITLALANGDADAIATAFYTNFIMGDYLQNLVWELRDVTFDFSSYVSETMRNYDGMDERVFNIATILGISIAIVLAILLAHIIQEPISQLKFAVNEVTSGNMAYPIRMSHQDDIGKLSHDIADMVESISDMINTSAAQKHRIEQQQINEDFVKKLLDNSPFYMEFWDVDGNVLDCNENLLALLGIPNKETFAQRFYKISAEMQPCGTNAKALNHKMIHTSLEEGSANTEWTYLLPDGSELPTNSTWAKISHQEESMIIVYRHDLRPIKNAMRRELELEARNQAKSRFLARMSHEIRTPITAVMGISEIQLRKKEVPPYIEESFIKIYDYSKTLLHIVNDILDFSKIESGKMNIVEKDYNMADLASDASFLHFIYLENSSISFEMHVDSNLPAKMHGDLLRIRQIINNLLTNAFKYTESGAVILSFSHTKSEQDDYINLVIAIKDNGMGMSEKQLTDLQRNDSDYLRLHEQEKSYVSGTGLGIPIVRNMVQIMNGEINIESAVGKGTLVTISIPQKKVGNDILGEELATKLQNFDTVAWSNSEEFDFKPEQMPYGKVLVVDDVETNLYVAEAMLSFFGLHIDLVESGEKAIEKIEQGEVYDIIFLDHMMPGMDGIEVADTLRKMDYINPIVALTANAIKGQKEIFMNSGFSGFMSKPIDIKLLYSYLVKFVKK